jgi:hypothetical protein
MGLLKEFSSKSDYPATKSLVIKMAGFEFSLTVAML